MDKEHECAGRTDGYGGFSCVACGKYNDFTQCVAIERYDDHMSINPGNIKILGKFDDTQANAIYNGIKHLIKKGEPKPSPLNFVVYHEYSDGGGRAEMIYVGNDKGLAFEALMRFLKTSPCAGSVKLMEEKDN